MLSLAEGALDLNAQKLLSVLWEFYRDQYGEYTYWFMGIKGYKNEVWDAAVTTVWNAKNAIWKLCKKVNRCPMITSFHKFA